jgi:predicted aspartyl protease
MSVDADITLISGVDLALAEAKLLSKSQIRTLQAKAVIDPQVSELLIPKRVKNALGLDLAETRNTEIKGRWFQADIYRYVRVQFENRQAIADAYVIPGQTEIVIGRSLMLAMDILLIPGYGLCVNPEHPNVARIVMT